ncbi:MAG: EF2563 family selenium-dependent molybdenum hydroxylase system protein [Armatimonadetes bacterium]|nr:EF2563 family selenium-dependent molybdenum hydroxylase system protein [Armatimonadota bacterium]
MKDILVLIKGAGDLASGVAHRLHRCGFVPVLTELPRPLVVRRTVAFAAAVEEGEVVVEGVRAAPAAGPEDAARLRAAGVIPVVVDPAGEMVRVLRPTVLVDAIMAKCNTGTRISDAPVVIALGPGFCAGRDAHAVVETKRGHYLGRVIWEGTALPNTGEPGPVDGFTFQRVLRAPAAGIFTASRKIGEIVRAQDVVGFVGEHPVRAEISGVLRGLIADGCPVEKGLKIGDIDPRGRPEYCFTISEKARAVAGGVLEAMLHLLNRLNL